MGAAAGSDSSESPHSGGDGLHGLFARSSRAPTVVTEAVGWASKCLQTSVVRLLPGVEQDLVLTYVNNVCCNNAKCGKAGCADKRVNFNRMLWFLVIRGACVRVYEPDGSVDLVVFCLPNSKTCPNRWLRLKNQHIPHPVYETKTN